MDYEMDYEAWLKEHGLLDRVKELTDGPITCTVCGLFGWSNTAEGISYWSNIDDKMDEAVASRWKPKRIYLGGE